MKTALKIISFIVLIMIGMSSVTKAQNTTVCFNVTIIDSCSGTWAGGYCVRSYVECGSYQYCSNTYCNTSWTPGTYQIRYTCTIDHIVSDQCYYIHVTVCRDQTPPTCCGNAIPIGPLFDTSLSDCTNNNTTVVLK